MTVLNWILGEMAEDMSWIELAQAMLHIRRAIQLDSCWVTQGRSHTTELFACRFVLFLS